MRLSFLFAFQRLVKLYIAAYPARFSLNVCIDRRSFLRAPWLFYCFRTFLLCGSDTVSFALCLAMRFYDHRGLLRASAATAMPFCRRRYKRRRFFLCCMHCTACTCDISWMVAVLFFAAFFDLFCVFYANCYGKDCVSVIFLVFLPLPRKTIRHTSFRRFRYCPVYAALRSDGRRYRRRRHEFASAAASSLHFFYCRIKTQAEFGVGYNGFIDCFRQILARCVDGVISD